MSNLNCDRNISINEDSFSKEQIFNYYDSRLQRRLEISLNKKKDEEALELIESIAHVRYFWNQIYTDDELDESLSVLSSRIIGDEIVYAHSVNKDKVLFYDYFGLDARGLACIYIKALCNLGFDVIYVGYAQAKNAQPVLDSIMSANNVSREYLEGKTLKEMMLMLKEVLERHCAQNVLIYTSPWDVCGVGVFGKLTGSTRFFINLTDHAYWLGTSSFDYCIEFRDYGEYISRTCRGIDPNKLVMLPYYPFMKKELQKNKKKENVIFSGGSLYKTIDESGTFYRVVDEVMSREKTVRFCYFGDGDSSKMKILMEKYPKRVRYENESPDFYETLADAKIFLNTYPVSGALMVQYAAKLDVVPVTLMHDDESYPLLLNAEKLNVAFEDEKELIEEIVKLLNDDSYYINKQRSLAESVIPEEVFEEELKNIIINKKSSFEYDSGKTYEIESFRKTYRNNFDKRDVIMSIRSNIILKVFPEDFLRKISYWISR